MKMNSFTLFLFFFLFFIKWSYAEIEPQVNAITNTLEQDQSEEEFDIEKINNPFVVKNVEPVKPIVAETKPQPAPEKINEIQLPQLNVQPPPEPEPIVRPSVKLQGVIWGVQNPQVIINNQVYSIGDALPGTAHKTKDGKGQVEAAKIDVIEKSQIKVLYMGQTFIYDIQ